MTLTEEQVEREVADILNQDQWPLWPVLPMTRLGHDEIGIVLCSRMTRVYLVNLFSLPDKEDWSDVPRVDFESVEEMVRHGWVGD